MSLSTNRFYSLSGIAILVFAAALLLINSILLMVGIPVTGYQVIIASVFTVGFIWWGVRFDFSDHCRRWFGEMLALMIVLFVVSVWLNGLINDASFDGQTYHAEAIIHLHNGWNPFYEFTPKDAAFADYLGFFSKGAWINAAAIYGLTGNIEQGKVFNTLLLIASFGISLSALSTFQTLSRRQVFLFSALLAFNPVSMCQQFTFYVDGQLASCLVMTIGLLILLEHEFDRILLTGLFSVALVILNIKLNGVIYFGILTAGYWVWYWWRKKPHRMHLLTTMIAGAIIGIPLLSYNPFIMQYANQFLARGNPFYPLDWSTLIAIDRNSPPDFIGKDRFWKLGVSLFSRSEVELYTNSQLKLPFMVDPQEVRAFYTTDVRVGGFGPFFSGALVIAAILLILKVVLYKQKAMFAPIIMLFIGLIIVSVLSNPEGWWARYAPQLWFVPVLIAVTVAASRPSGWLRWLNWALIAVLGFNLLLISSMYFISVATRDQTLKQQIDEIKNLESAAHPLPVNFKGFALVRHRFDVNGITYQEVNTLPCAEDKRSWVKLSETQFCLPSTP